MKVINARNVNQALSLGAYLMVTEGVPVASRAGDTLEIPEPVATVYQRPWERVLISAVRDANPFFHLMEALWIIAGREDVGFLTHFNKRMGDYSDDGKVFNAPYGFRMRVTTSDDTRLKMNSGIDFGLNPKDQLEEIIQILRTDPNSRQAVLQIWSVDDLTKSTKDKACNMSVVFRIRDSQLHITVYNRSNDMVWGAYGANAVQFSMLQEYVAAKLGLRMGTYTQVSNSFHVYTDGVGGKLWEKIVTKYSYLNEFDHYNRFSELVYMHPLDMDNFDHDLKSFFNAYDQFGIEEVSKLNCWKSYYFQALISPMLKTYQAYKAKNVADIKDNLSDVLADDWMTAVTDWLVNRGVDL